MGGMDVRAEIVAAAEAYRRADADREEHRRRLAELFRQARAENVGPAEIARLTDHLYTKEHISRIAPPTPFANKRSGVSESEMKQLIYARNVLAHGLPPLGGSMPELSAKERVLLLVLVEPVTDTELATRMQMSSDELTRAISELKAKLNI